jgi:hypothetical protein
MPSPKRPSWLSGLVIEHVCCLSIQAVCGAIDAGEIAGVPAGARTIPQIFAEHALDECRPRMLRASDAVQFHEEILG